MTTPTRGDNVLAYCLKGASVIGMASMVTFPAEPQFYVLCATLITAVSGVAAQILRDKAANKKAEWEFKRESSRREFERAETQRFRDSMAQNVLKTNQTAQELHGELVKNTRITEEVNAKVAGDKDK